ncbi:unnamed protein product [Lactuca saligna]|uniref:Epidermal patterning factor-like protein n=1 Tax=Lactuca saligna TaxID=75948 RepID=A0AA35VEW0_LACSI|nr:unnamed protein product [Lactuca saligna]
MKGRFCRFVMIMLYIMRAISRPLEPNHVSPPPTDLLPSQQASTAAHIMSSQFNMGSKKTADQGFLSKNEDTMKNEEDDRYERGIENRIGSRPPSCEHKCYGCSPCEATQVPTTSHVGIQYTNYEPEGWKCKCGPTFYSP